APWRASIPPARRRCQTPRPRSPPGTPMRLGDRLLRCAAVLPPEVQTAVAPLAPARVERVHRPELGLTAYVVLDNTALGPATGGVRVARYPDERSAAIDACRLARTMTYKCALGGVDAGGGKIV